MTGYGVARVFRPSQRVPDWLRCYRHVILVALLALLLLGHGLGSYGLLEDNEARFFEISWEMEQSGDWLVPRLNFISHFHKPPGTFWLVAASLRAFGESEWAGRLPVALAGCLTLAFTFALSRRWGGLADGARAVLILVTSLEFWFLSRLVLTDMFLTATVTAAFAFAWGSRQTSRSAHWLGFWVSMGVSLLFKGPIGPVLVGSVIGVHRLSDGKSKASWNLRPCRGLLLAFLIAAPWYVIVCWRHDGLLEYFLNFQTAQRLLTTVHGRPGAWWFYLPVLAAGFFPWSTSLPHALIGAFKRRDAVDRLLLLWIAFPLLFFSCSGSKLPTYLLPIFPALALLLARDGRSATRLRAQGTTALLTLVIFAASLGAYLHHGAAAQIIPAVPYLTAVLSVIAFTNLGAWAFSRKIDDEPWFALPGCSFALCLLLLSNALGPCDQAYSARHLASLIKATPGVEVVEVSDHVHGLPYYLGRRVVQVDYPRETQFEASQDYHSFLFLTLPSYFAAQPSQSIPLIVIRSSDYDKHFHTGRPAQAAGPWLLLRGRPAPAAPAQATPPAQNAGSFGGGAGVQRRG